MIGSVQLVPCPLNGRLAGQFRRARKHTACRRSGGGASRPLLRMSASQRILRHAARRRSEDARRKYALMAGISTTGVVLSCVAWASDRTKCALGRRLLLRSWSACAWGPVSLRLRRARAGGERDQLICCRFRARRLPQVAIDDDLAIVDCRLSVRAPASASDAVDGSPAPRAHRLSQRWRRAWIRQSRGLDIAKSVVQVWARANRAGLCRGCAGGDRRRRKWPGTADHRTIPTICGAWRRRGPSWSAAHWRP